MSAQPRFLARGRMSIKLKQSAIALNSNHDSPTEVVHASYRTESRGELSYTRAEVEIKVVLDPGFSLS